MPGSLSKFRKGEDGRRIPSPAPSESSESSSSASSSSSEMSQDQMSEDSGIGSSVGSSPGLVDEDENRYYVEKILDYKVHKGRKEMYFVKWFYWPDVYNNWEPGEHLDECPELKEEFFNLNPHKKSIHLKFEIKKQEAERVFLVDESYKMEFGVMYYREVIDRPKPVAIHAYKYDPTVMQEPAYLVQFKIPEEGEKGLLSYVMQSVAVRVFADQIACYLSIFKIKFDNDDFNIHLNGSVDFSKWKLTSMTPVANVERVQSRRVEL